MKKILGYFVMLFLFSCNKENAPDCFKTNGAQVVETRILTPFSAIALNDNMEVNLQPGNEYKVELSGGENVLPKIITSVESKTLTIENHNRCNFVRGYKRKIVLTITAPYIKSVLNNSVGNFFILNGFVQDSISLQTENSGDITLNGHYDYIKTSTSGNGDIYLSGETDYLVSYMNGVNFLYAQDLTVRDTVFVQSNSLADCNLNLKDVKRFEYNIQQSGNIYYYGDPTTIVNLGDGIAEGRLIKKD